MRLEDLVTPKLLSSLDKLFLSLKSNATANGNGKRKSRIKGNSLDYSDFRPYTQGDDIKKIDWKAYARSEKTNIKLYDEEKQSKISIILDISKSMDYGANAENKLLMSKLIASALSYIYIKNDDSVDVFSLSDSLKPIMLNAYSRFKFNELIKHLDNTESANEINFNAKLNQITDKALVFILSDFYTDDGFEKLAHSLQKKNCSLVFLHILTKAELEPELNGNFLLTDMESNEKKAIFITSKQIAEYKKIISEHKNKLKAFCQKRGIMYFDLSTDINISEQIFNVLNRLNRE